MRRFTAIHGFFSRLFFLLLLVAGGWLHAQERQGQGTVPQTTPNQELVPGVPATYSSEDLPSVVSIPIAMTPLSGLPYVFALDRRDAAQMTAADAAVVSSLNPELSGKAALAGFDLDTPGWRYRQVLCPALPDYLILSFSHGPDPNGSSQFAAALPRNGREVRVVSSFAHGMLPFEAAWNKPGTYEVFNRMLLRERGLRSMGGAPNWLVIGMCFAELSGHHVQVLTHRQQPEDSLDMLRLHGNQPQLRIDPDRGAEVLFSDASKPGVTTQWDLRFDRHGQITSVSRSAERQPAKIALRP